MRTPTDIKTIELDECVTVRYRDTMNQLRISIAELECYIANLVDFQKRSLYSSEGSFAKTGFFYGSDLVSAKSVSDAPFSK